MHLSVGQLRRHDGFHSAFLEHDRDILVWLPPGYGPAVGTSALNSRLEPASNHRYPVLYMQDGQNLFEPDTAFQKGEHWRLGETATELIAAGEIEPLIIVGIYNTGEHRIDEYAPTARPEKGGGGQADRYGRMLVEELKPFVDREYRTLPSAASTGIGGSSLGGLLTVHLGLRYPTVFSRLAVLSPSVWWDDRVILREVAALPGKLPFRIWLDVGTAEGPEVTADARALRDALLAKGWKEGEDLAYLEAEGGEHNERSWAARVEPALRHLFPRA